jgi:RNA recognition motif-containing protein
MAHKLFVGGLNFATSNERLRELFAECGQVDSATVVTGSAEEAEQAISRYNGQEIDGRRLQVEKAKEGGSGGGGRRGGGFGGGARSGYGGGGGSRRW